MLRQTPRIEGCTSRCWLRAACHGATVAALATASAVTNIVLIMITPLFYLARTGSVSYHGESEALTRCHSCNQFCTTTICGELTDESAPDAFLIMRNRCPSSDTSNVRRLTLTLPRIRPSTTAIGDCDCQVAPGDTTVLITVPSSAM